MHCAVPRRRNIFLTWLIENGLLLKPAQDKRYSNFFLNVFKVDFEIPSSFRWRVICRVGRLVKSSKQTTCPMPFSSLHHSTMVIFHICVSGGRVVSPENRPHSGMIAVHHVFKSASLTDLGSKMKVGTSLSS